jgi:hypothetical protein
MDKFRERPMEASLHRRLGRLRPDPLTLASRRAEIAYLEVQVAHTREQQRRAQEHLTVLAEEQTEQVEALRADRARLAGLNALAQAAGGRIPDQAAEEERRKLRVRLEERPASLAAALQADLERLDVEAKELSEKVAFSKRQLAEDEAIQAQFDQERLEMAVDAVRKGVATPRDQQIVTEAKAWPEQR